MVAMESGDKVMPVRRDVSDSLCSRRAADVSDSLCSRRAALVHVTDEAISVQHSELIHRHLPFAS
jgi:hypothetical protein